MLIEYMNLQFSQKTGIFLKQGLTLIDYRVAMLSKFIKQTYVQIKYQSLLAIERTMKAKSILLMFLLSIII